MLHPAARERGYRLHHHASIGSTNEEALERGRAGDPGRLWVLADRQTAGRGRIGRAWDSPAGNHHASLLLVDPCPQRLAPQLAFVAGVAVVKALVAVAGEGMGIALKWPNDVLCGGAKLAGLLVEGTSGGRSAHSSGFSAVLGFGVNCASHPTHLSYPTTHLGLLAGEAGTRDALFAALSASAIDALDLWDRGRNFAGIRRAWLDHALPPGTPLAVARPDATHVGTFKTVDDDGRLILETGSGCLTVEAGDVFLADMTAAS
ncbi:biotin--[acetyl-CoA-carboxylase] ligase [Lichenibacterium minor]|uniref:biotin--[biotin carboxyl-carrier protein] ligase n=1 Tax=Lichenibacterium minor TaxID=2316528 RepID=A0A4V1RUJ8_9HYPH|nr:biotin--[acetyl-CoA-carboxylase] ligase [Lichenibacterium minor]RYC31404.1 biotin--[acetyl-CoA-carboxylase] ligase [Lichenibacterium minor]